MAHSIQSLRKTQKQRVPSLVTHFLH